MFRIVLGCIFVACCWSPILQKGFLLFRTVSVLRHDRLWTRHCQEETQTLSRFWLVVWNIFCFSIFSIFPIYWECHHPNWLYYVFQRGRYYNTNQDLFGLLPKSGPVASRPHWLFLFVSWDIWDWLSLKPIPWSIDSSVSLGGSQPWIQVYYFMILLMIHIINALILRINICIYLYIYIYMYIVTHTYIHVYNIYVYIHVSIYIYIYTYIHIYIYIYTQ